MNEDDRICSVCGENIDDGQEYGPCMPYTPHWRTWILAQVIFIIILLWFRVFGL